MQSQRKHILFLTSWYPDRILKDNGDFIQRHAQTVALRNNVTVVHAIKDEKLKRNKFQVEVTEKRGVKEVVVYVKPSRFRPFNLIYLWQAYLHGLKYVSSFDIIHLNVVYPAGLIGIYLKNKFKKPLLLTEHWTGLHPKNFKQLSFYKKFLIQKILKSVDLVLPVSSHLGKSIQQIETSVKYQVIPNVVDLDRFSVTSSPKNKCIEFLHLSNLNDQHKNITGMLNVAVRLVKEGYVFKFHIGGNGDLNLIKEFITNHQLQDFILPFSRLEHDEVKAKMNDSNCFVLFSRYENQPCVQAEALACGVPVIATNVGGVGEFLPDGFGILIDSENEEDLYQAMLEVINKKSFASPLEMHHYAKDNFSKEEIANQYHKVYQEILK